MYLLRLYIFLFFNILWNCSLQWLSSVSGTHHMISHTVVLALASAIVVLVRRNVSSTVSRIRR